MKIIDLFKRDISRQFIKFCLIGLEKTILTYLIFLILFYFFSVNYLIAGPIGFVAGILFGFVFDKIYTFESKKKPYKEIVKYFILYGFSFGFYFFSLRFLVETFIINPIIANLILQPILLVVNFLASKLLVFENKKW